MLIETDTEETIDFKINTIMQGFKSDPSIYQENTDEIIFLFLKQNKESLNEWFNWFTGK